MVLLVSFFGTPKKLLPGSPFERGPFLTLFWLSKRGEKISIVRYKESKSQTNMTMENPPFEYVCPIENGDFPAIVMWSFSVV